MGFWRAADEQFARLKIRGFRRFLEDIRSSLWRATGKSNVSSLVTVFKRHSSNAVNKVAKEHGNFQPRLSFR